MDMDDDDDLESFLQERRAKVMEDKAILEQDPPYMEIRTRPRGEQSQARNENIPLTRGLKEEGPGLSLPLGEEYERKKQRLQQELRLDYRRYMAQVLPAKTENPRSDSRTVPENPEVPFSTKESVLRELQPRSDAANMMKAVHEPSKGQCQWAEAVTAQGGQLRNVGVDCDSGLDYSSEEVDLDWDQNGRRRVRHSQKIRSSGRRQQQQYYKTDGNVLQPWSREMEGCERQHRHDDRALRQKREVEPPAVQENYRHRRHGTAVPRQPQSWVPVWQRSRSGLDDDWPQFSTGLVIGHREAPVEQRRRKELYRQELQEQIAEQQRNRKREKDLKLCVAATGATDPEKRPDRIPQLWEVGGGAVLQRTWSAIGGATWGTDQVRPSRSHPPERITLERPRIAFPSPLLGALEVIEDSSLSPEKENVSRGRWSAMRDEDPHSVPPPPPSTLTEFCGTPSVKTCFCHGSRKARWPSSACWGESDLPVFAPSQNECPSPSRALRAGQPRMRPAAERGALTYQEALKQQIQDRQERRRRELQEAEQYEAKLEAEMKAYSPWGRGGGGAPLRDHLGNLITDLNRMHKSNEVAYLHPGSGGRRWTRPVDGQSDRDSSGHTVPGSVSADTSPVAPTGSVELPTPPAAQEHDSYKDDLRQQIEEKRRRQAEEREQLRMEEEKEEKRLEEQRAQIRREYEEEQEKRRCKEMEQRAKNEELLRQAEEWRQEEERRKQERGKRENESQRRQYERERQARLEEVPREPSPPIPTLQRRHASHYRPHPPTNSRRPAPVQSEHHLSGSQSPPVPARRNQLRAAEERRGILSKLSALRRQLHSEQRRLEEQLLQVDMEELDTPLSIRSKNCPLQDVFDTGRPHVQGPVKRPSTKTIEPVNIQNSPSFSQSGNRGVGELSSPARRSHVLRTSCAERPPRSMLLESESAFIGLSGQEILVPRDPNANTRQLSARERRRMERMAEFHNEVRSRETVQPVERSRRSCLRSEAASLDKVGSETWKRPGTSDTLKNLMKDQDQGASPPERTMGSTWEGPSTYHG